MTKRNFETPMALVIAGMGDSSYNNSTTLLEDFIFGDLPETFNKDVTLLVPYEKQMSKSMDRLLNGWAVGNDRQNPEYDIVAYVDPDAGHRSISSAKESFQYQESDLPTVADSRAFEEAMSALVEYQKKGHEVAVILAYDPESEHDRRLVGDAKNFQSIPVLNLCEGLVDSFAGFKTTDEQIAEDNAREEFETKEKIRLAAEKEQAILDEPEKPAVKKAAAPRKRVAKKAATKPVEPVTQHTPLEGLDEFAAPKTVEELQKEIQEETDMSALADKEMKERLFLEYQETGKITAGEVSYSVGDIVNVAGMDFTKHSESPFETEGLISVKKDNLIAMGEGVKEMAEAFAKTIDALTRMVEGK